MKKEKPILFQTEMVQVILEGRKTMTRRIVKPQPFPGSTYSNNTFNPPKLEIRGGSLWADFYNTVTDRTASIKCKYKVDDILWVKETFTIIDWWEDSKAVEVMFEDAKTFIKKLTDDEWSKFEKWQEKTERKSSLFLFKSLSRIHLKVTGIRAEKIQEITESDAINEGFNNKEEFKQLWIMINGLNSWESNNFVWCIEFKKL